MTMELVAAWFTMKTTAIRWNSKAVSAVNSSDVRFKQLAASKRSLNYQADS
jgi:hypothetical protein